MVSMVFFLGESGFSLFVMMEPPSLIRIISVQ